MRTGLRFLKWGKPLLFVSGPVVLLVAGGCGHADHASDQALQKVATALDELKTQVQADHTVASSLDRISEQIKQQNAVLNRALGKVIPVVMPPEWEKQLTELEVRIKDAARWPKDACEAQGFLDQTSSLFKGLPAWAEADYLPRLTPVRWAAMAFVSLNRPRDGTTLRALVEEMNGFADDKPEGGSADLQRRLIEDSRLLSVKLDPANLAEAIEKARKYVQNVDAPSADTSADIADAYDLLGLHEMKGAEADKVRTLRKQLHRAMVARQAEQQAASLKERWAVVQGLKKEQAGLYEVSANMLLQEVVTARVALALESVKQPTLDALETNLRRVVTDIAVQAAKREEERQAKALREYQRWALKEVNTFESVFKEAGDTVHTDWSAWKLGFNRGWTDAEFAKVRDAMVDHLLPVNLALADLPVQKRYEQAFEKGWRQLDGREDQTQVAVATAMTVKKPLRDFFEEETPQARAQRAYEEWCAKQIEMYNVAFTGVLEAVAKRKSIDWKKVVGSLWGDWEGSRGDVVVWEVIQKKLLTDWEDRDRELVRDALTRYLLPVDDKLLDPLCRIQFEQAYKMGWNQLKPADQTVVAERQKTTKKKRLEDFLEKQP